MAKDVNKPVDNVEIEKVDGKDAPEIVIEAAADERPASSVDDGIAELKKKLDEERLGRADAEKRAHEAAQREFKARGDVDDTNLALVNTAIETVKGNMTGLKANYAQLAAAGEWEKAADVQALMATSAAKLLQLENGKEALANRPKQQAPQVASAVERFAQTRTPRSAAWVRSHPQFIGESGPNG